MPLAVDPLLRMMYERANPNVCEFVEVAQPDVGQVLRRWTDQLSVNPPRLSETPASTTQSSPGGGIMLKATAASIVNLYTDALIRIPLDVIDPSTILRGVGWSLDPGMKPFRLKRVTVKISVNATETNTNLELQIYRMRGVPGRLTTVTGSGLTTTTQQIQYTPTPLLAKPARVNIITFFTGPNTTADVVFDLTEYELDVEHRNVPAPSLVQVGEIPELIFEVGVTDKSAKSNYRWEEDNTTGRVVAGIGTFADITWQKKLPNGTVPTDPNDPRAVWQRTAQAQVPCIKLEVDTYPTTSQEVYAITLSRAPVAASTGRIVFIRERPLDTTTTLEISSAGSGGPWTAVTDGVSLTDLAIPRQATYHLRATLNASADTHRSPVIEALGIEYRTPFDCTAEALIDPPPQDINTPFLDAAIGEGKCTLVRAGRRDYHDIASEIMTAAPATQLEVDHFLGSRHPKITRANWLRLGRSIVSAAEPTSTSEILSLISYLKTTKRKIPQRAEVVNQILAAAAGTTATAIAVSAPLPGTVAGHEYDNLNYYIRLVSTAVAGLAPGMIFPVSGNNTTTELDLTTPGMPAALATGDTFELHSATYAQPKLSWTNADPADAWYDIFTNKLGVPPERIGLSALGTAARAGLPPKVTDRAPGDVATQNRLKVSRTLTDQVEAKQEIDALSFLMQGSTLEVGGQVVFVPVYEYLDPSGALVIPPAAVAATFDARDYFNLTTPRGLESRVTTLACTYGVDSSLGNDAAPPATVVFTDADAVAAYTQQDLEEIGNAEIPGNVEAWCYNSYDGGLYLGQLAARQVVRAASTGLRLWSWSSVEMHPDLVAGDIVTLLTDRYTDYDPTRQVPIRGLYGFALVLTHVAPNRKDFRGYLLGLTSATPVRGGSGTAGVGLVGQPSIGNVVFDAAGNLLVSLNMGTPPGGGFRVAASGAGLPTDATVDNATFYPGTTATVNLGAGWAAGATVQIKASAYASSDPAGARSLPSTASAKVSGGAVGNTFTGTPTQSGVNYVANTVQFNWVWAGAAATFNVWVSELGSSFTRVATGLAASPYVYSTSEDIRSSGGNTNDHVVFYVEAVIGGVVVATSAHNDVAYRAQV